MISKHDLSSKLEALRARHETLLKRVEMLEQGKTLFVTTDECEAEEEEVQELKAHVICLEGKIRKKNKYINELKEEIARCGDTVYQKDLNIERLNKALAQAQKFNPDSVMHDFQHHLAHILVSEASTHQENLYDRIKDELARILNVV